MKRDFFAEQKQLITQYLLRFLDEKERTTSTAFFGTDVMRRLKTFVQEGKMIRGGLVLLACGMFSETTTEDALIVASALEVLHASLLIHDDIMDNDQTRRGRATIFAQYQTLAQQENLQQSEQFGKNQGICVGDIGFFLAFELLARLSCDPDSKTKLYQLFSTELTMVGLMQMQDVYFGLTSQPIATNDVLTLYTYKTARYTFSLPLIAGALLSDQPTNILTQLGKLGESLGIIFQIKDDELDLFGTEEQIGKPVGSDLREGKKTLLALSLFEMATPEQRQKLQTIFGNSNLTPEMITYVQHLVQTTGAGEKVQQQVEKLHALASQTIDSLPITEEYKDLLRSLAQYNTNRTK